MAAPVLVVWPSRGLHYFSAGGRNHFNPYSGVCWAALNWLSLDCAFGHYYRVYQLRPLGPSHVYGGDSAARASVRFGGEHVGGNSDRHPDFLLARDIASRDAHL